MINKKSKTPIIVIAICAFILIAAALTVLILTGKIGGERRDPDKERFEMLLRERYGEEFVCLEWEGTGVFEKPIRMSGICAPARDISLRFMADMEIGSETKLSEDYPWALASLQLSAELTKMFNKIWNEFSVDSGFLIIEDHNSAEFVPKIREGTFDWRYYMEQSISGSNFDFGVNAICTVLVDGSAATLSHEEEWNALHGLMKEYNAELNKLDRYPGLSLSIYFAPSELYGECAARMKAPRSLGSDNDDYLEFLEEKLGEPVYIGAGCGLTLDMIAEWKEPYLEYRKNIGKVNNQTEENT